jgi:hypothetical protein
MVRGIRLFGVTDCAGHPKPEALLQEQTVEISVCGDALNRCHDGSFALHATSDLLQEGQMLNHNSHTSADVDL